MRRCYFPVLWSFSKRKFLSQSEESDKGSWCKGSRFTSFYPSSLAGGIENKVQVLDFGMFNVVPKIYQRKCNCISIYSFIFTRMLNSCFMNYVKKVSSKSESLHLPLRHHRSMKLNHLAQVLHGLQAYKHTQNLGFSRQVSKRPLRIWLSTSISSQWYVLCLWSIPAKASTYCCGLDDFFANHLGMQYIISISIGTACHKERFCLWEIIWTATTYNLYSALPGSLENQERFLSESPSSHPTSLEKKSSPKSGQQILYSNKGTTKTFWPKKT